jgi:hypothetical protein
VRATAAAGVRAWGAAGAREIAGEAVVAAAESRAGEVAAAREGIRAVGLEGRVEPATR